MEFNYPQFLSRTEYKDALMDVNYWKDHISSVVDFSPQLRCDSKLLEHISVPSFFPGTCPVFLLNKTYALKLYGDFGNGEVVYKTEKFIYKCLQTSTESCEWAPKMVAYGSLRKIYLKKHNNNNHNNNNGTHQNQEIKLQKKKIPKWSYIVTTFMEGITLDEICGQQPLKSNSEWKPWVKQLCQVLKNLQAIHIPQTPKTPPQLLNDFLINFLVQQYQTPVKELHQKRGSLPQRLIDSIESYLPKSVEELRKLFSDVPTVLLHSDLNPEHMFLCEDTELQKESGKKGWLLNGIIDLGDCKVGYEYYEFATLFLGTFYGDKGLLRDFLLEYPLGRKWNSIEQKKDFEYKILCICLLHEFDMFRWSYYEIDWQSVKDWDDYANICFNVDDDRSLPIFSFYQKNKK